eukprot:9449440-Karenia_brevis.AAC.1
MLQSVLERIGARNLVAEAKLYVMHDKNNNANLVMSSHVDDVKGAATEEQRKHLLAEFEKEFGKLKVSIRAFERIGIMHEQDEKTKAIWTHQHHYVKQLHPINVEAQ